MEFCGIIWYKFIYYNFELIITVIPLLITMLKWKKNLVLRFSVCHPCKLTNSPSKTTDKNWLVNVIIRLLLSNLSRPKVITLSGAYCIGMLTWKSQVLVSIHFWTIPRTDITFELRWDRCWKGNWCQLALNLGTAGHCAHSSNAALGCSTP